MDIEQFKKQANLEVVETVSLNNNKTKIISSFYRKEIDEVVFIYIKVLKKDILTNKRHAYNKYYKINNKGVCKRQFLKQLLCNNLY